MWCGERKGVSGPSLSMGAVWDRTSDVNCEREELLRPWWGDAMERARSASGVENRAWCFAGGRVYSRLWYLDDGPGTCQNVLPDDESLGDDMSRVKMAHPAIDERKKHKWAG